MKKRAFTLVELLVVIAIIALLMALLMPALRLAQDQAMGIICVNNLRQLSIAWFTYSNENDDELVGGHIGRNSYDWVQGPPSGDNTIEGKKIGIREGNLFPYVKDIDVYHCRGDARIDMADQKAFRSYSIAGGANGEGWANSYKIAKTLSEIRSPGRTYMFVEEADNRGWNVGSWVMNLNRTDQWVDPFAIWHNNKSTLGFADGHAEKHNWVDKSTIEMSEKQQNFYDVPSDEGEDYRYMAMGFPRAYF
jgi:prepilin-type N-terminal cleavage/methylation domain-containing protein/prepilin-type processing-associated H-X9-DG protein